MTSTTIAQHGTQPLNFGPEWLRALSTPDSATSIPSSTGSGTGNVFQFLATKYRYSKDEILALRANVSERLSEDVQKEILENLKDVESVFRPDAVEPLALTAPTAEETAKMNSLSSYISGRTPGGAGRASNNAQQTTQADARNGRGGGNAMPNGGRGGSRGRGGRDTNTYGASRSQTNNAEENSENGNGLEDTSVSSSSSWSRGGQQARGGSFGNRVRSFDNQDQPQTFRRGGSTRHSSDGWRRSRGDDDENGNEQTQDTSSTANGASAWNARGGQTKRGATASMEQRTKSNDKWNHGDDRSGHSNSYESNQSRGATGSGWRANGSTASDRDSQAQRSQPKRDRMPEWMDDNIDDDSHLGDATFEQDGTFTRSASIPQKNSNDQAKVQSHSGSDESSSSSSSHVAPSQSQEEIKSDKSSSPPADAAAAHIPTVSKTLISQPTASVQPSMRTWDDDFDQSDVATTVVESTLAEDFDHDYPSSHSVYATSARSLSTKATPSTTAAPVISQPRASQASLIIDDKQWFYKDPQNIVQGPFSSADMERWFAAGYFTILLPVKRSGEPHFSTIQQLTKELGRLPFRNDASLVPPTPPIQPQQQPTAVSDAHKFHSMTYNSPSTTAAAAAATANAYMEEYLLQQHQARQNAQHPLLFNRQASMPLSSNDQKQVSPSSKMSSQFQAYPSSSSRQQSSLLTSDAINDPATIYRQQQHLHRSMSSAAHQQPSKTAFYDEVPPPYRHSQSTSSKNISFFPSNVLVSQQQQQQQPPTQTDSIMARLAQAMQTRGNPGNERLEQQQQRDVDFERLRIFQQAEQVRLQREEEGRLQLEDLRKKHEINNCRQINFDQLTKSMNNSNRSTVNEIDAFAALQQSIQFQKDQQAEIDAEKEENVRRYQQQYREQSQPQSLFNLPEASNWGRHSSYSNEPTQSSNFADLHDQEQERRSREAAARQHAKTRPTGNQQASQWTASSNLLNASLQDIQRQHQLTQNEVRQASHQITPGPSSSSAWASQFQQASAAQQSTSSLLWDNQPSSSATKLTATSSNKPSTPTGFQSSNGDLGRRDNELPSVSARTQQALAKWTERQFKDDLQPIDVPMLVQLLKEIDNPGEIVEYIRPYIGSVSKAKEFAHGFLAKRNQFTQAESHADNERLFELVAATKPISGGDSDGDDDGFQLASSNGQKKKAKKLKGQKLDSGVV